MRDHGTKPDCDVAIVGGGPAGLSAALVLGRCRRRVVLIDSGKPRNAASRAMHGFLGRDGAAPVQLLRDGRRELQRYDTVLVRDGLVQDVKVVGQSFAVVLESGKALQARKVLLATGVQDELPEIEGFAELYGVSAFHCPYCDGWEWRDRAIAVYGKDERGVGLALELLGWSRDVALFCDGWPGMPEEGRERLRRNGVGLFEKAVGRFEGREGKLAGVRLQGGELIARDVLFFVTTTTQSCGIASSLGCEFDEKGTVNTGEYEKTNVPGLFVAGDASRHAGLAIVAAAEGARAAFAINMELLEEELV